MGINKEKIFNLVLLVLLILRVLWKRILLKY